METRKYGRGGWPLVPSTRFQGETTLACPVCWATNVIMSCRYPVRGSGPNGRGRLGDYGTVETNQCGNCGHFTQFDAAPMPPAAPICAICGEQSPDRGSLRGCVHRWGPTDHHFQAMPPAAPAKDGGS